MHSWRDPPTLDFSSETADFEISIDILTDRRQSRVSAMRISTER